jgi:hypothetical protein
MRSVIAQNGCERRRMPSAVDQHRDLPSTSTHPWHVQAMRKIKNEFMMNW